MHILTDHGEWWIDDKVIEQIGEMIYYGGIDYVLQNHPWSVGRGEATPAVEVRKRESRKLLTKGLGRVRA